MRSVGLADFKAMWAQHRDEFHEAVERVGQSGWLVLGKEVEGFEAALAAYWGAPHAVGVASGLDALEIAFRVEGMKAGDRVITTPLSAFATTLAILKVGAVPVFCDVDESGLLDLEAVDAACRKQAAQFIVPVHLYGHAMNLRSLREIAKLHGLVVIEDCAQSIGARSGDEAVGAGSRVWATSFYPTKNLGALGDAGALLTTEASKRDAARRLRDYGQSDKYIHDEVGMNSRLDELQAALLRTVQLKHLPAQTERRRVLAQRYIESLNRGLVELPPAPEQSQSVWHLFPVLVQEREAFRAHLQAQGVGTGLHYPKLIPSQRAMEGATHETFGTLSRATRFAEHQVSLPLHPFMTDEDAAQVIAAVNSFKARS